MVEGVLGCLRKLCQMNLKITIVFNNNMLKVYVPWSPWVAQQFKDTTLILAQVMI